MEISRSELSASLRLLILTTNPTGTFYPPHHLAMTKWVAWAEALERGEPVSLIGIPDPDSSSPSSAAASPSTSTP